MKKYIGVDIGGMSIKIGLVNEEGSLLDKTVVKTESGAESVIKSLGEGLVAFLEKNGLTEKDVEGVGIGCPGAVTGKTGVVEYSNNLGWKNVRLVDGLKNMWTFPINFPTTPTWPPSAKSFSARRRDMKMWSCSRSEQA